jgi:predicted PurR-regulated permease PerM
MPAREPPRTLPLWSTVLLGLAGTAITLWGLHAARALIAPVLLAFVLTVVAHPLIGALTRRGVPRWLAVAVLVLVVDGGLIAFTLAVVVSVGQLATVLPQYADQWQHLLDGVRSDLSAVGIGREQVQQIVSAIGPGPALSALGGLLKATAGALAGLVLVLVIALFMAVDAAGLPERLAAVPRVSPGLRTALGEFARSTRRYVVITTVFGFAVAAVDTIALYLLGIPLALLWGLLSFLTNYVPNIGFVLGLVPPVLLALLVGGPGLALVVVAIYCAANFVLQSVLQPMVVGDAVGLSVTLTFLSTILWTVVIGPIGAVLAIPLTLLAYAVLVGQDPDRRWAKVLLAGASGSAADGAVATGGRSGGGTSRTAPAPRHRAGAAGSSAVDDAGRSRRGHAFARTRLAVIGGRSRPWHRPQPSRTSSPSSTSSSSVPS